MCSTGGSSSGALPGQAGPRRSVRPRSCWVAEAVDTAVRGSLPLRLVSLVALDATRGDPLEEASLHAKERTARAEALAKLPKLLTN